MSSNRTKPAVILGTMIYGIRGEQVRINDPKVVQQILNEYRRFGHDELDTARFYCEGSTEELLGSLGVQTNQGFKLATKVYPYQPGIHKREPLKAHFYKSLEALKVSKVDIFYLHAPDHTTPIEETLKGVQELYEAGGFTEFGISNYTAWQVVEIYYICKQNGYVLPTVYQGMYNAVTRGVESELFAVLRKFGLRFYAYNPIAGGLFTGKLTRKGIGEKGTRFDPDTFVGKMYIERYGKEPQYDAIQDLLSVCRKHNISGTEAALRWINHHGKLDPSRGDAIIVGASSLAQLTENMENLEKGPLPDEIINALDDAWIKVLPVSPNYFR